MVAPQSLLIVLAGRPGTGKSTVAGRLVQELRAAYLRIDSVAVPIIRSALTSDEAGAAVVGYDIARSVARENLQLGVPVVVDGLNATHARREEWVAFACATGTRLTFVETFLADESEHRHRVERRSGGDSGYLGPTWEEMLTMNYEPWNASRYGERLALEMSNTDSAVASVLTHLTTSSTAG
jgi:predicted kinase